jgi:PAS domain S-box-containing protein
MPSSFERWMRTAVRAVDRLWHGLPFSTLGSLRLTVKVSLLGAGSVLITAVALVALVVWQSGEYNRLAQREVDQLIDADLDHITRGVANLVRTENEAVQLQVSSNVNVARHVLAGSGPITLSAQRAEWIAVNQLTGSSDHIQLPKLLIGGRWLGQNADPAVATPVVDEVTDLVGEASTIFQRMNDRGDMLRVATTVTDATGTRAIGTFIPAIEPGGSENPVVAAIMKGATYHGRAYVVNAWYITAYEPITDRLGRIVGMLYVGVRQAVAEARVRQAILQTKVGRTGYVYVLGATGESRGRYIISQRGERDGEDIWNSRDSDGRLMIQAIVNNAVALGPGELGIERYRWQNPGESAPRWKVARLAYYQPWDWVIGTSVYEDELRSYETPLVDGRFRMMRIMGVAGLVIAVAIGLLGVLVAWTIVRPVRQMTTAVETIIAGNLDQVVEVQSRDEVGSLAQAFNVMTERLNVTMAGLRKSEETYREIFENAIEGLFQTTMEGRFSSVNPAMARTLGYESPGDLTRAVTDMRQQLFVDPDDRDAFAADLYEHGRVLHREVEMSCKDARRAWVSISAQVNPGEAGEQPFIQGFLTDITARKKAEQERVTLEGRLLQAQKMESIGLLAGGIAHDFNNLLSPILGFSELLLDERPPDDPSSRTLQHIREAALRARDLTHQLLAFGRKQVLEVQVVDLRDVVSRFVEILRRTIIESIRIDLIVSPQSCVVRADIGQIEQVLMNLAVNARDAMPQGGMLTIEVEPVVLDDFTDGRHPGLQAGRYVMLALSDNGIGMDEDTRAHLFEPFFTTKERGKGTGLGLSTVFGIVKQHDGGIFVYSEPGRGTCIKVFLPHRQDGVVLSTPAIEEPTPATPATETIFVVEDDSMVRELGCAILGRLGYRVLASNGADDCLSRVENGDEHIDLLLTDVVLTGTNGKEIYTRLRARREGLRVIYMSGYTSEVIVHHGVLDPGVHFIQKPLSVGALAEKVRTVLAMPAPSGS